MRRPERSPLKPGKPTPARYSGPDRETRDGVKERDGWRCLSCGETDRTKLVTNHRQSGGMGGGRKQTPGWLTCACFICNFRYETEPEWAKAGGWKVPTPVDALTIPVLDFATDRLYLLDDDSGRTELAA